ncbi:MAG: phosphatase PAP2 family protein, partial [Bacillota bacterium]|nr:phosphatase PAP2 family protein [Bacillota bacterium]
VLVYLNARQPWWWAGPTRRLLTALMALWPMVVGGSRVYLDAHWASDIMGGFLLGTAHFFASLWIFGRWLARRGMTAAEAAD